MGINNRVQSAKAERIMRNRIRAAYAVGGDNC